uniref:Testis expressed 13B n=1 Tax=Nannospalax galili TaxID=1026970 RepID=A0A8C6QUM1_NANGA
MALNPKDPNSGFRYWKVLMFINEQMGKHPKGPEFYLENLTQSWEEVEDKFRFLLQDSEVPREVQEACAWSSLALGMRFACMQGHLQARRVQWLCDFASKHRSAAHALVSDLKQLIQQQEIERKETASQLRLTQAKLAEVQRERDLLRLKLLHMNSEGLYRGCQPQGQERTAMIAQPLAWNLS